MNWWYSQDDDIKEAIKSSNDPSDLSSNQKDIIDEATKTSEWRGYIGDYYEEMYWEGGHHYVIEDNTTTWNEFEETSRNVTNGTAVNTHNDTNYTDVQVNETLIIRTINTTMYFEQTDDILAYGLNWTWTEGWQLIEYVYMLEHWEFYDVNDTSISFYYWYKEISSGYSDWQYIGPNGAGHYINLPYQETLNWFVEVITFEEIIIPLDTNTTIEIPDEIKIGNLVDITGTVIDELENIVGNILINVNINGQDFPTPVDEFGNWLVQYLPTTIGDFNINVTWEGNEYYNTFINSLVFNVVDESTVTDEVEEEESIDESTKEYPIQTSYEYLKNANLDTKEDNSANDEDSVGKNLPGNNNTLEDSLAKANMKETGIPIIIVLLTLLSSLGLIIRKK